MERRAVLTDSMRNIRDTTFELGSFQGDADSSLYHHTDVRAAASPLI